MTLVVVQVEGQEAPVVGVGTAAHVAEKIGKLGRFTESAKDVWDQIISLKAPVGGEEIMVPLSRVTSWMDLPAEMEDQVVRGAMAGREEMSAASRSV